MKTKPYVKILALSAVMMVMNACQGNTAETFEQQVGVADTTGFSQPSRPAKDPAKEVPGSNTAEAPRIERKLIRQGEISFMTGDLKRSRNYLDSLAQARMAYVSNESITEAFDRIEHHITFRIPASAFEPFVKQVEAFAGVLESKNISVADVTAEYIDIEARMKTRLAVEERFRQLLDRAQNIEEILMLENEIARQRSEIEAAEGRLKYLADRSALSTLEIVLIQKKSNPVQFASRAGDGVQKGWKGLLDFLIAMIHIWPILLTGAGLLILYRIRQKKTPGSH